MSLAWQGMGIAASLMVFGSLGCRQAKAKAEKRKTPMNSYFYAYVLDNVWHSKSFSFHFSAHLLLLFDY